MTSDLLKKPVTLTCGAFLLGCYAVVFAEVFLRLFAPQAIVPRYVTAAPYGVRMNMPNAEYRQVTPETRVTIRVNEQGLRAETAYDTEKAQGVSRVLLFGDSYFLGYEADLEESFAWQLEQQLRAARCPVEVLNFAVSGFGTAEMLRTLQEKGLHFDPDLVIFQWHHTDPADNQRANLYQLADGRLAPTGADYVPTVRTRELVARIPFYTLVSENSHLYAAAREKLVRLIKDAKTGGALVLEQPPQARGPVTVLDQPDRPPASALDLALLAEAEQTALAADAGFYVVDIPSFHDRTHFSSAFRLLPDGLTESASYITPIAEFRSAANAETKLYWERGHMHLTPLGNRLLAEKVREELLLWSEDRLGCQ